jgi:hypothetical protein
LKKYAYTVNMDANILYDLRKKNIGDFFFGWVPGAGCWVLGAGCWVLGAGCWILDAGCWILDAGYWMLDV